jgi:hypothetical protein
MDIEVIARVLVVGVFIFLVSPLQGAEVRSPLNSDATPTVETRSAAKTMPRHHWRRRHLRHRGWTHHLDPGW